MIAATYALLGKIAYQVPEEAVADKIMTVSVLPRPTRVGLSKDFLDTDGTIIYAKLVNYLAEDFCRNGQIVGDLMLNSGHYNLILSDRLAHLEYLMAHLPKHLRDQAVMVDGKMTSKKGKAKREQAIEDMRAGKILYAYDIDTNTNVGKALLVKSFPVLPGDEEELVGIIFPISDEI